MISDLKVLNGNLELLFNEYTYEYTVVVDDNITSLEFSYKLAPDTYVNIRSNNISSDNNIVYLDVYNVDNLVTYTFYVYREDTNDVSGILNYRKSLEVKNEEVIEPYKIQILTISIFFLIIILFSLIFKRKKR